MPQLGEIISWDAPAEVAAETFKTAMTAAGLEDYLPPLKAGTAMSRAVARFTKGRVVKALKPVKPGAKRYQFTTEEPNGDGFLHYDRETAVVFDPATRTVSAPDKPELNPEIQEALDHKLAFYEGGDVTKAVQNVLNAQGDLFQLKARASFYFVPEKFRAILETVAQVLTDVGGEIIRFPIGDDQTSGKAVKDAVAAGLEQTAGQYAKAIDDLEIADARPSTVKGLADKVAALKLKAEGYGYLLQEAEEKVKATIAEADRALRRKIRAALPADMAV